MVIQEDTRALDYSSSDNVLGPEDLSSRQERHRKSTTIHANSETLIRMEFELVCVQLRPKEHSRSRAQARGSFGRPWSMAICGLIGSLLSSSCQKRDSLAFWKYQLRLS